MGWRMPAVEGVLFPESFPLPDNLPGEAREFPESTSAPHLRQVRFSENKRWLSGGSDMLPRQYHSDRQPAESPDALASVRQGKEFIPVIEMNSSERELAAPSRTLVIF